MATKWENKGDGITIEPGPDGEILTAQNGEWVSAPPPVGVVTTYDHTQAIASTSWSVVHNMGFKPNVQARDNTARVVVCGVTHVSDNALTLEFLTALSGTAHCS